MVSSLELASEVKSVNYVTNKMKSAMEVATEWSVIKSAAIYIYDDKLKWYLWLQYEVQWNSKLDDIRAEYCNSCPMKSAVQIAANME